MCSVQRKDLPHTAVTDDEYFEEVVEFDVSGVIEGHDVKFGIECPSVLRYTRFLYLTVFATSRCLHAWTGSEREMTQHLESSCFQENTCDAYFAITDNETVCF